MERFLHPFLHHGCDNAVLFLSRTISLIVKTLDAITGIHIHTHKAKKRKIGLVFVSVGCLDKKWFLNQLAVFLHSLLLFLLYHQKLLFCTIFYQCYQLYVLNPILAECFLKFYQLNCTLNMKLSSIMKRFIDSSWQHWFTHLYHKEWSMDGY